MKPTSPPHHTYTVFNATAAARDQPEPADTEAPVGFEPAPHLLVNTVPLATEQEKVELWQVLHPTRQRPVGPEGPHLDARQ